MFRRKPIIQNGKKWSMETLPMIPEKFQYEVTRQKAKQFNVVKTLLQETRSR
ncbi:hypothetical protein RCO48_33335 [Peribacillus frigoritolerans]|nr:hypothetical protein [Peribacillus frigoritolerans]